MYREATQMRKKKRKTKAKAQHPLKRKKNLYITTNAPERTPSAGSAQICWICSSKHIETLDFVSLHTLLIL